MFGDDLREHRFGDDVSDVRPSESLGDLRHIRKQREGKNEKDGGKAITLCHLEPLCTLLVKSVSACQRDALLGGRFGLGFSWHLREQESNCACEATFKIMLALIAAPAISNEAGTPFLRAPLSITGS